jgi:hypothetical protein
MSELESGDHLLVPPSLLRLMPLFRDRHSQWIGLFGVHLDTYLLHRESETMGFNRMATSLALAESASQHPLSA